MADFNMSAFVRNLKDVYLEYLKTGRLPEKVPELPKFENNELKVVCFEPQEMLTERQLVRELDQGRGMLDVLLAIAFQVGYDQGITRINEERGPLEKLLDRLDKFDHNKPK